MKSQLSLVAPPHRSKGESPNLGSGPGIPHERYRSKDMEAPAQHRAGISHPFPSTSAIIAPLSSMNLIAPMVNMNVLLSFNKWTVTRLLSAFWQMSSKSGRPNTTKSPWDQSKFGGSPWESGPCLSVHPQHLRVAMLHSFCMFQQVPTVMLEMKHNI